MGSSYSEPKSPAFRCIIRDKFQGRVGFREGFISYIFSNSLGFLTASKLFGMLSTVLPLKHRNTTMSLPGLLICKYQVTGGPRIAHATLTSQVIDGPCVVDLRRFGAVHISCCITV